MRFILAVLLTASLGSACATTPAPAIREERLPDAACDARVLDLNRRLCADKGLGFTGPTPTRACGACQP